MQVSPANRLLLPGVHVYLGSRVRNNVKSMIN
jgi:hypothetical protein